MLGNGRLLVASVSETIRIAIRLALPLVEQVEVKCLVHFNKI